VNAARRALLASVVVTALGSTACSGALPLFHGAKTLPKGFTMAGAGVAANVVRGEASTALRSAQETTVVGAAVQPSDQSAYRRGALVAASFAPGVTPWVGARAGLGHDFEAGLSYTQRALRIDARRSIELTKAIHFSAGIGAMSILGRRGDGSSGDLAGLDLAGLRGLGVDIPLLVGWESSGELIRLYGGARLGYEAVDGDIGVSSIAKPGEVDPATGAAIGSKVSISGHRTWATGIAGFALGFRHFFGVVELAAGAGWARGTVDGDSVKATGIVLSPGAALVARF
jgi:hypothetical protein